MTTTPYQGNCPFMSLSADLMAKQELHSLSRKHRLRTLPNIKAKGPGTIEISGCAMLDFCSNDYLGLSMHPALKKAAGEALEQWGCGARASRLMSGDLEIHHILEKKAARFKGTQAALLFGSGYLANMGVISALAGKKDAIFMDKLCHASMVDGARLSGARIHRYRHNDMDHLDHLLRANREKSRRALILSETLFSMDGDEAPFQDLVQLKNTHEAILIMDEAHAVGAIGDSGEGLIPKCQAEAVDIQIGTFGKALGSYGAFCALSPEMKQLLVNLARPFIFSTAMPPAVAGANLAALELAEKNVQGRALLLELSTRLRQSISTKTGLESPGRFHIVPVITGPDQKTVALAEHLQQHGFWVRAVRPPTVPPGTARLRLSLTTDLHAEDLDRLAETLGHALQKTP